MQIATAQWHCVGNTRCRMMDDIAASRCVIHLMISDTAAEICTIRPLCLLSEMLLAIWGGRCCVTDNFAASQYVFRLVKSDTATMICTIA